MFTCEGGDKGQKEREKGDGSHVFFFFHRVSRFLCNCGLQVSILYL